jgi:cell division protein ZipA
MQANWSLILNVLLLTGVLIAIIRMLRTKRTVEAPARAQQPSVGKNFDKMDDVIAVRKVNRETPMPSVMQAAFSSSTSAPISQPSLQARTQPQSLHERAHSAPNLVASHQEPQAAVETLSVAAVVEEQVVVTQQSFTPSSLMIFLLAKENRQLAGYELLQTILSAGLRFGEGHLFHRHQYPNGQGPVMCSLATATASGVFDLQNIGAFSVHGLCLFMQSSGNASIDLERFTIMLDTARQLSDDLDTHMLDDERHAWSDMSEQRYLAMLSPADADVAEREFA